MLLIATHPYLNIHSAAFTGNLGLVSYAISSGVSPSAVLDGITPLHAACAGQTNSNNEAVVNYLIVHGADVNALRGGSRRASTESARTPRVGGAVGESIAFATYAAAVSLVASHDMSPHTPSFISIPN